MTHDRARISALVDGECDVGERETVLAHVMGCDDCLAFYRHERAAKAAVAGDHGSAVGAPVGLVAALLALGPASTETIHSTHGARPAPDRHTRPSGPSASTGPGRPGELPGQRRRRLRRAAKGLALSVLGAGLVCAIAFVVGGDARPHVADVQLVALGTHHARAEAAGGARPTSVSTSTTKRTGTETASLVLTAPASAPAATLGSFTLVASDDVAGIDGLAASIYRDGSAWVSVFRQPGRLDPENLPGFSTHHLDGATLHRRLGTPNYQVWTCRDVTYTVVGDSARSLDDVSAQLPHVCPARGGWARVGHGMHRAAGWLSPIS